MLQASHVEYVYNSLNYVVIDEEGYLLDPSDWSRAFTQGRARAADIELSARHWQLIEIIRDKYLRLGSLPLMRLVCKAAGFEKQIKKQKKALDKVGGKVGSSWPTATAASCRRSSSRRCSSRRSATRPSRAWSLALRPDPSDTSSVS